MATKLRINSSSSSSSSSSLSSPSSILEISIKFHHFFLVFLGLLFVFVALVNSAGTGDRSKPSSTMPSSTTLPSQHQTLFSSENPAAKTMDFGPRTSKNRKSKRGEFEASDHEVPSGPNPISNR